MGIQFKCSIVKYLILFIFIILNNVLFAQDISLYDLNRTISKNDYGKVIYIKDGIYRNIQINILKKQNIKIRPRNFGKVMITGNSSILIDNSKRIIIDGFNFNNNSIEELIKVNNSSDCQITNNLFTQNGSQRYGSVIILDGYSNRVIVDFNTFDANKAIGVAVLENSKDVLIKNNLFKNVPNVKSIYPKSDGNGMECIQIGRKGDFDSYATIQNNYFFNIKGDLSEIISVKSNKVNINKNIFLDSRGGVTLRRSNNSIISNNYFKSVSNSIRIFGKNHKVVGNTIIGSISGIQLPSGDTDDNEIGLSFSYFRSKNIFIGDNMIYNTKVPIVLGNGYTSKKSKLPKSIEIIENKFDVDYWWVDQKNVSRKDQFHNNILLSNEDIRKMPEFKSGKGW